MPSGSKGKGGCLTLANALKGRFTVPPPAMQGQSGHLEASDQGAPGLRRHRERCDPCSWTSPVSVHLNDVGQALAGAADPRAPPWRCVNSEASSTPADRGRGPASPPRCNSSPAAPVPSEHGSSPAQLCPGSPLGRKPTRTRPVPALQQPERMETRGSSHLKVLD